MNRYEMNVGSNADWIETTREKWTETITDIMEGSDE